MNDVSLGILVGQVEEVNGACSVSDIDGDVTNLFQSIAAFVHAQKLGNCSSSLCANLAR